MSNNHTQPNTRLYSAFGYCLHSSESFSPWLVETLQLPVDISIQRIQKPLFSFNSKNHLYSHPTLISGQPFSQIYRQGDIWGMRMAEIGDFYFQHQEISFIPQLPDYFPSVHTAVLSNVFSFWMEQQGLRTIHGAALNWQGQTFVLMAHSTQGKSTLAASLLQKGASLLSDDISPIEAIQDRFMLRPSYPTMRLGYDQVKHFLGSQSELAIVLPKLNKALIPIGRSGWGKFETTSKPPKCFYSLDRKHSESKKIEISHLSQIEAVLELVKRSFVLRTPFLTGKAAERLDFLTCLAQQIPVKRLVYPSGYEHLDAVCEAIQRDLSDL